jgi:hypothetical protein
MYAVAAAGQRESLPLPRPGPYRPCAPVPQPVGVRHAVGPNLSGDHQLTALCGADIDGWFMFRALRFDTRHAAACQRCAQLVACSGTQRPRPPVRPAPGGTAGDVR